MNDRDVMDTSFSMKLHPQLRRTPGRSREQGYVLLSILLVIALMVIAMGIVIPSITFEIKRDREEEFIHRGTQYSRAIRAYYKKFGRYPAKIEDLESANNLRFLRKRYKDPLNCTPECQDFKLLHYGDVKLSSNLIMPGATPIGAPGNGAPGFSQGTAFNTNSSPSNLNSVGQNQMINNAINGAVASQAQANSSGQSNAAGQDQSDSTEKPADSGDQLSNRTFGGGPIVGVATANKDTTIREFNHKKKYNEWQFVYDPGTDRGMLITTPYQPLLAMFGQQQNLNGQNGQNGIGNNNPGQPPAGMQNNPNLPSGGSSSPQPNDTPNQQ